MKHVVHVVIVCFHRVVIIVAVIVVINEACTRLPFMNDQLDLSQQRRLNGGEGCAVSRADFYTFSLTTFAAMLPRARSLTRAHYYRTS